LRVQDRVGGQMKKPDGRYICVEPCMYSNVAVHYGGIDPVGYWWRGKGRALQGRVT